MSAVRVVRDVPCNGSWHQEQVDGLRRCHTCDGTGTITEPVTCAGCKWWDRDNRNHTPADYGYCLLAQETPEYSPPDDAPFGPACNCDNDRASQWVWTDETFACAAWEAR